MVLENFSKCSEDKCKWLCVAAVLLSSYRCSFGSLDRNVSTEASLSSFAEQRSCNRPVKQPIKRYMINTANGAGGNGVKEGDMAIGEEACAIYALLTAIHMALNPNELLGLTVDDREVADVYQQYADIQEKYLPVMECVVSPSFEINGDFIRKREKVIDKVHSKRHCSIEDFAKIADGNLNENFQEGIKKEGLVEKLRELAILYYDKECPEGTPLENLPGAESGFRELRWELFEDFIGVVMSMEADSLDLTGLNAIDDNEQRMRLMANGWDNFYREKTCDVQEQGRLFRENIGKLRQCKSCMNTAGYFLIGMLKIRPCGDCMLYEKFTLNHFTADGEESRKVHFDRSFFSSIGNNRCPKKEINVVTLALLDEKEEAWDWHDEALTPDNRPRWVTYTMELAKSRRKELAQYERRWKNLRKEFSCKFKQQKGSGDKSKKWGEYVAFEKLKAEIGKYSIAGVKALIPIPLPVLIVDKGNEDVVSDDRKIFTKDDLPERFKDTKLYSPRMCHDEQLNEWISALGIYEDFFSLLFEEIWISKRLTCRSKLTQGHLHANSSRK